MRVRWSSRTRRSRRDAYARGPAARRARRVARRWSPAADLLDLLHAADALVTVESLSAVEALVLGRPVVVLNMPTHLRDAGGRGRRPGRARGRGSRGRALRALLDDADRARAPRPRRARATCRELAMGVDGGATARIVAPAARRRRPRRPPGASAW